MSLRWWFGLWIICLLAFERRSISFQDSTKDGRPFSSACERNQEPIYQVLRGYLTPEGNVLEIGSGTGQHLAYFAPRFPKLKWFPSDLSSNHSSIRSWTQGLQNVESPLGYEIGVDSFPQISFRYVYTANTFHIMRWELVLQLIEDLGASPENEIWFFLYGPFNYDGKFTSDSNRNFNEWLKSTFPGGGIRDFEAVCDQFQQKGFERVADYGMPANNRLIVFHRVISNNR